MHCFRRLLQLVQVVELDVTTPHLFTQFVSLNMRQTLHMSLQSSNVEQRPLRKKWHLDLGGKFTSLVQHLPRKMRKIDANTLRSTRNMLLHVRSVLNSYSFNSWLLSFLRLLLGSLISGGRRARNFASRCRGLLQRPILRSHLTCKVFFFDFSPLQVSLLIQFLVL